MRHPPPLVRDPRAPRLRRHTASGPARLTQTVSHARQTAGNGHTRYGNRRLRWPCAALDHAPDRTLRRSFHSDRMRLACHCTGSGARHIAIARPGWRVLPPDSGADTSPDRNTAMSAVLVSPLAFPVRSAPDNAGRHRTTVSPRHRADRIAPDMWLGRTADGP